MVNLSMIKLGDRVKVKKKISHYYGKSGIVIKIQSNKWLKVYFSKDNQVVMYQANEIERV